MTNEALQKPFQSEVKQAGLSRAIRTQQTACLDQYEHGPVGVIHPQGIWLGGVQPADISQIVARRIVQGEILAELVIADLCRDNPDCPQRAGS